VTPSLETWSGGISRGGGGNDQHHGGGGSSSGGGGGEEGMTPDGSSDGGESQLSDLSRLKWWAVVGVLWEQYVEVLERHPLRTKSITAAIIAILGDTLAQVRRRREDEEGGGR